MTCFYLLFGMVFAFLLGSVPFGLVVAKTFKGIDPRKAGSGNIGSTNVARLCGWPCGLLTLFCDIMKGTLPVLIAVYLLPEQFQQSLVALAAVLGHIKSPFLGFKGGKGISVGLGAGLGFCWPVALSMLGVFFVFAIPSGFVSLGSIFAAASLPLMGLLFGIRGVALIPLAVVSVTVIWAHRSNIKKLLNHEERKFTIRKVKDKISGSADGVDANDAPSGNGGDRS
jgi:glycerol-3-phosphate acyltransferase PlsY